jgi:hypothetical protein
VVYNLNCPHKCYLHDKYERKLCESRDVNNSDTIIFITSHVQCTRYYKKNVWYTLICSKERNFEKKTRLGSCTKIEREGKIFEVGWYVQCAYKLDLCIQNCKQPNCYRFMYCQTIFRIFDNLGILFFEFERRT